MAGNPWSRYKDLESTNTKTPGGELALDENIGPWTKFPSEKSTLRNIRETVNYPVERLGEAAIGATKGIGKGLQEGYAESSLDFSPEQIEKIKKSSEFLKDYPTARKYVEAGIATPYTIGNFLGAATGVINKGLAGGLAGGYAGATGVTDPNELRRLTSQAEREVGGIIESEGGRAPETLYPSPKQVIKPEVEPIPKAKPLKLLPIPEGEPAPWEQFASQKKPIEIEGVKTEKNKAPNPEEPLALPTPKYEQSSEISTLTSGLESEIKDTLSESKGGPFNLDEHIIKPIEEPEGKSAGAAFAPHPNYPKNPRKEYVRNIEDKLYTLGKHAEADKIEALQTIKQIPEEVKDKKIDALFYAYGEGDPLAVLTPKQKNMYDKYLVPLKKREAAAYQLRNQFWDPGNLGYDPNYMHRMVKGASNKFDQYVGTSTTDPFLTGTGANKTSTSAFKDRVFYTIQDKITGLRHVVSAQGEKLSLITPNGTVPIRNVKFNSKPQIGAQLTVANHPFTLENALTREIESVSNPNDVSYHKSAIANTITNTLEMEAANRALAFVEALKYSPEFEAYSRPYGTRGVPSDWAEPNMPSFRGTLVHPDLKYALDDFYQKIGDFERFAVAANRATTMTLFWSPVVHALNAGYHWYTSRGWDWIRPKGMKSLAIDSAKAIKEVITLGPKYRQLLKEGNALQYAGVANQDFYKSMLKAVGQDIKKNPNKWDPIARMIGVGPSDLFKLLYNGSSKALWGISDMFMVARILELERKGMNTSRAIKAAESHNISYRVPSKILNSRIFKKIITHPAMFVFSPYHYGMIRSHLHIFKDLLTGSGEGRFEALGQALATISLMVFIQPFLNGILQSVMGNKDIELSPKGSISLPSHAIEVGKGEKSPWELLASVLTPASLTKGLMEMFTNRDSYTGQNIVEPGDIRQGNLLRAGGQFAERALQTAVQPYAMGAQAQRSGTSLGKSIALTGLGLREKTPKQKAKKAYGRMIQDINAAKRKAKSRGPIESGVSSLIDLWEGR